MEADLYVFRFIGCGRKGRRRIVGGVSTAENEIPWMVGVLTAGDVYYGCGAVLLSCDPVIVVSAAHCFLR